MFGRKKPGMEVSAANRERLVEAYRALIVEIDDIIDRCTYFLSEPALSDVPMEYVAPLQETVEREKAYRAQVTHRIATIPTAHLVFDELVQEIDTINGATHAAVELIRCVAAEAAATSILGELKNTYGP